MTWMYIWLGVTAAALIVEFITSEMVSIWFAGGGLVAMILAGLGLSVYVHLPVFIVLSFVLMLCFRRMVLKKLGKGGIKTNAENAVGKEVKLLSPIGFGTPGSIKINDVVWTAVAEDENAEIPEGTTVRIKGLEGNKYIVEKI